MGRQRFWGQRKAKSGSGDKKDVEEKRIKIMEKEGDKIKRKSEKEGEEEEEEFEGSECDFLRPHGEVINVDFVFRDLDPANYGMVKAFLNDLIPPGKVMSFEESCDIADLISGDPTLGCVISQDGTDDMFGYTTLIPLRTYGKNPANTKSTQILTRIILDTGFKSNVYTILKGATDGAEIMKKILSEYTSSNSFPYVLFSSRLLNIPDEIIPHIYDSLIKDIEWAEKEKEGFIRPTHIFYIGKCFPTAKGSEMFRLIEDDMLFENSDFVWWFNAPKKKEIFNDDGSRVMVLAMTFQKFQKSVNDLKEYWKKFGMYK